jgi:hypothetical protein
MHVTGGNHADQSPGIPQGEGDVQKMLLIGLAQCVHARLLLTMFHVLYQQQRLVEECLFGFRLYC